MAVNLSPDQFDKILTCIESVLDQIEAAKGNSVRLPAEELNLLTQFELARNFMQTALSPGKRSDLQDVFGKDCARISRLRVLLTERVELSDMNATDQRMASCLKACESVEKVLEDLGLDSTLEEARVKERVAREHRQHAGASPIISSSQAASKSQSSGVEYSNEAGVGRAGGLNEFGTAWRGFTSTFSERVSSTLDAARASASAATTANLTTRSGAAGTPEAEAIVPSAGLCDLRLQVISATELGAPEYRLGDLTAGFFSSGASAARLEAVYVELELGGRCIKTAPGQTDAVSRRVTFDDERHLFAYGGQPFLKIRVLDKRKLQSAIRGNPIIGEGSLPLSPESMDSKLNHVEVSLSRAGASAGAVHLWYQILPAPEDSSYWHEDSPEVHNSADASGGYSDEAGRLSCPAHSLEDAAEGETFTTPPGSPRT